MDLITRLENLHSSMLERDYGVAVLIGEAIEALKKDITPKPIEIVWKPKKDSTNPSAWETRGENHYAYVLIPYRSLDGKKYNPGKREGLWSGAANHKGKEGFATKEEAMAHCEKVIRADAHKYVDMAKPYL